MGRPLRHMPEPNRPVEITCRCMQARYLLKPSRQVNELILGVIGRAQFKYPDVKLYLMVVMSNHMHMIVSAPSVNHIAEFMCHVNANIAKEIGKLHDWRGNFWERRYDSQPVLDDNSLIRRVRYLLSNGVKEDLVEKPEKWPGVNCVRALTRGEAMTGDWVKRSEQFANSLLKKPKDDEEFTTRYPVELTPLPCWADLTPSAMQARWRHMVKAVEQEHEKRRKHEAVTVLGAQGVRMQDPHFKPIDPDRSPRPGCHGSTPEIRKAYMEEYYLFVETYRELLEQVISGNYEALAHFPEGCFIPTFVKKHFAEMPRAPD